MIIVDFIGVGNSLSVNMLCVEILLLKISQVE